MRGDDLLLAHLAALPELDEEDERDPRQTARERLDDELGPELAAMLLAGLTGPPPVRRAARGS
jgi:hypothetical protein